MTTNPDLDAFFAKPQPWQDEYRALRALLLGLPLTEERKWGWPCYTANGRNITLIHGFKDYCALLFFKGALMPDPHAILIQQTDNVQSARQIRFTGAADITALEDVLKSYVAEAMAIDAAGLKLPKRSPDALVYPDEFTAILADHPDLRTAFEALTPGRQRAYNLFFTAPKQSQTRTARVEKSIPRILDGKGLDDR